MIKKLFRKLFGYHPYDIMSFRETMDLTDMPIVTFYQGDKKFHFLLDTGSNKSIIDSSILNKVEHGEEKSEASLFGLDGVKREVKACEITFSYKDKEFSYDYIITDMSAPFGEVKKSTGAELNGILGALFFKKFRYILDFDSLIAYSKGKR